MKLRRLQVKGEDPAWHFLSIRLSPRIGPKSALNLTLDAEFKLVPDLELLSVLRTLQSSGLQRFLEEFC